MLDYFICDAVEFFYHYVTYFMRNDVELLAK